MRLIEIHHSSACDGVEGLTRAFVADELSEQQVEAGVQAAQAAYRAHLAALPPAPPEAVLGFGGPRYSDFPDLTVREVQQRWQQAKAAGEAYRAWRNQANKGFEHFLFADPAFTREEDAPALEITLDWGHLHGPDPLVLRKEASR